MPKHGCSEFLKNSFINEFRKKSKQPAKVDYNEVEQFYNSDDAGANITTDLRVETVQDMIGDEISGALNAIPVDFRTVIILSDLEGFTYEEMSKILGYSDWNSKIKVTQGTKYVEGKISSLRQRNGLC